MSERGTFAVDRGIWGNVAFAREPFTEREAFLWLIGEAAFVPHEKRVGGEEVSLQRGQTCHSIRFMADTWQWSKSRVDRFISRLEKRDMVERDSGTEPTVITICKYEDYQPKIKAQRDTSRDTERDSSGTPAGQSRDKLEKGNNTSLRSVVSDRGRRHVWPADYRELFWAAYPRHTARKKGWEALDKIALSDAVAFEDVIAGCHRLRAAGSDVRFIPHPATWLNGARWEDDIPANPPPGTRQPVSGSSAGNRSNFLLNVITGGNNGIPNHDQRQFDLNGLLGDASHGRSDRDVPRSPGGGAGRFPQEGVRRVASPERR